MKRILHRILTTLTLFPLCVCACAAAQPQLPAYDDLTAACQDVRAAVYDHQTHVSFSLTAKAICGRSTAAIRDILTDVLEGYIDYTISFSKADDLLHIDIKGQIRPALNILHAWETGDRSPLTQDECAVLDMALEIASNCRQGAHSALDIERAVYDAVCRHVTYYSTQPHPAFGTEEYKRCYSCIGGLLDGETLCMGYAEIFYLIGRLAGLDVQMQYGFPGGGTEGKHAWNTVRIGQQTYMTDVCWGDTNGDIFEPSTPDYRYFNVGLDLQPKSRHPHPEAQIAQISAETSWAHTAFGAAKGGVLCASLDEAIDYAIRQHSKALPYAHVFLPDQRVTLDAVTDAMWTRMRADGIDTKWGRMTHPFAGGTYVIFRWVFE